MEIPIGEESVINKLDMTRDEKKIVTTNGSFDLLHVAHVRLLEKAKTFGDILVVLLNSDESVRSLKGTGRPIVPENERAEMLCALKSVDYVIIFEEDNPLRLLERIRPSVHVKGGSFIAARIAKEKEVVERFGGRLEVLPLEEGFSTTNLIASVLEKAGHQTPNTPG